MEPTLFVLVIVAVLLAVLVGLTVPVLVQLQATLKTARAWIERIGPKMDRSLTELEEVTKRVNRTSAGLEQSTKRAQVLLDVAGNLGQTLQKINHSMVATAAIGAALGPAILAAIKAFMERSAHAAPSPEQDSDPTPEDQEHSDTTELKQGEAR